MAPLANALERRRRLAAQLGRRASPTAPGSTAPVHGPWRCSPRPACGRGAVAGIVDGAPAKQGRRMPGTDIPIVAPDALLAADPEKILLMLPDLARASCATPGRELADRWVVYGDR